MVKLIEKMFHGDSLDYLERRIHRIESLTLGENTEVGKNENSSILERLQVLESKIPELDAKIPELQPLVNNLQKISPLLSGKVKSLREMFEYLSKLVVQKDEMQRHIQSIQTIQNLSHFINKENYTGNLKKKMSLPIQTIFCFRL